MEIYRVGVWEGEVRSVGQLQGTRGTRVLKLVWPNSIRHMALGTSTCQIQKILWHARLIFIKKLS